MPAKAGIQGRKDSIRPRLHHWIPACAGMTADRTHRPFERRPPILPPRRRGRRRYGPDVQSPPLRSGARRARRSGGCRRVLFPLDVPHPMSCARRRASRAGKTGSACVCTTGPRPNAG